MKKQFVNFSFKALVLAVGLFATSCNNDDSDSIAPDDDNNTEYNGNKFSIRSGFLIDGGSMDMFMDETAEEKTHYNYSFVLTDGTPTFSDGEVVSMHDGKIIISTVLLSPGSSQFNPGLFTYSDYSETEDDMSEEEIIEAYKDKHFFSIAFVLLDSDGDKNWGEEAPLMVEGGTIKVTGSSPNYTTEYELELDNGKTIKGSFTGKFNAVQG